MDLRTQITIGSDHIVAFCIDNFPLFAHDIVILKDLLPGVIVISFNPFLSAFNLTSQHPRFDNRLFFTEVHPLKQSLDSLRTKTTHQLIFK